MPLGTPLHKAWTVAESYVNASGGVLGKRVRFVEMDDGSDDDTQSNRGALVDRVANAFVGAKVAAVIGPNGSSQVLTAQNIYLQSQMLEITATATSTLLSSVQPDAGRFLFRTAPPDTLQGEALAKLANLGPAGATGAGDGGGNATGCQRLALFYYANAYGQPMADAVKQDFAGAIVGEVTTSSTKKNDYATEVFDDVLWQIFKGHQPSLLPNYRYMQLNDSFDSPRHASVISGVKQFVSLLAIGHAQIFGV